MAPLPRLLDLLEDVAHLRGKLKGGRIGHRRFPKARGRQLASTGGLLDERQGGSSKINGLFTFHLFRFQSPTNDPSLHLPSAPPNP